MEIISSPARLSGRATVPASKSHTIRGLLLGALADGESALESPLDSADTRSAADAVTAFGAVVDRRDDVWTVTGVNGSPRVPENVVDVGNSGTTLYMIMGTAALTDGWSVITGDGQIRRRSAAPLLDALANLGVHVFSTRGNGCAPIVIRGRMTGGATTIRGVSSQYISSLLMACPLADKATDIEVTLLNERPYVLMTFDWLESLGVTVQAADDLSRIHVPGGQRCRTFTRRIPGDFSSATFLAAAGAIAGGSVEIGNLDMNDRQGDREVVSILERMGATVDVTAKGVTVTGGGLHGIEVDMNAIPDALPMMAVCACFAEGRTVLGNVPQAREKETDRIAVMAAELAKLGAKVEELPDGLVIEGTGLRGGTVSGHGDHRVVMALTVAGCAASGPMRVDTAEAADITFPSFWSTMRSLGADIRVVD